MGARTVGSGFVVAAAAVLLAVVAFPGTAEARTASDPCVNPQFSDMVCTYVTGISNQCDATGIGGPINEDGQDYRCKNFDGPLAPNDPRQCPVNWRIGGSGGSSLSVNWDWDYWVDGGYWVLWDGSTPGEWPENQVLPRGDAGVVSMAVSLENWSYSEDTIKSRVYWFCEQLYSGLSARSAGGSSATAAGTGRAAIPLVGDAGEDNLRGDDAHNALIGHGGDDRLSGGDGEDRLHAGGGDDALSGGDHADLMHARSGADEALGGDGNDDILTGKGDDLSHGGDGGDQLFDDQGKDHLRGGPGNDRFSAHDGDRDRVDCGPGEDIAMLDRKDAAIGCEHVFRSARETPKTLPKI